MGEYLLPHGHYAKELFDAVIFATSSMTVLALYHPQMFTLLGGVDTYLYSAIAGIGGLSYSIRSLWPRVHVALKMS